MTQFRERSVTQKHKDRNRNKDKGKDKDKYTHTHRQYHRRIHYWEGRVCNAIPGEGCVTTKQRQVQRKRQGQRHSDTIITSDSILTGRVCNTILRELFRAIMTTYHVSWSTWSEIRHLSILFHWCPFLYVLVAFIGYGEWWWRSIKSNGVVRRAHNAATLRCATFQRDYIVCHSIKV